MNLIAKKRANKRSIQISKILCNIFFISFVFLAACQNQPLWTQLENKKLSGIDQSFRLQRLQAKSPATEYVKIYRSIVAPTLYSKCKWFPSDSRYAALVQNKCGGIKGGLMAFSRFLSEEDASKMGYPFIKNKGQIEYVDLPNSCWL